MFVAIVFVATLVAVAAAAPCLSLSLRLIAVLLYIKESKDNQLV